ncbi:MAG: hypothetical protein ACYCYM_13665 [Saccharofermentanales bacterium]
MSQTKSNNPINHTAITFSYRRGRTRIHKVTIEELGRPPHIRMLFNPVNNSLAVQGCEKKEKDTIRVPVNLFTPLGTFEISSMLFLESIRKRMGWIDSLTYHVSGHYDPATKLAVFNLNEYEIASDDE